jgi:hypothetical protein
LIVFFSVTQLFYSSGTDFPTTYGPHANVILFLTFWLKLFKFKAEGYFFLKHLLIPCPSRDPSAEKLWQHPTSPVQAGLANGLRQPPGSRIAGIGKNEIR